MGKFLKLVQVDSPNKHLPAPLVIGEIVTQIKDENYDETNFVKVKHNDGQNVSIFNNWYFEKYIPKDKQELILLSKIGSISPTKS